MFLISIIPAILFPWAIVANAAPPNSQELTAYIATQFVILLIYLYFFYSYLMEVWRSLKKIKYTQEEILKSSAKRFWHTLGAHIITTLLIIAASGAYILLYWLLYTDAITTGNQILAWPLILGLPLLIPGIYVSVRYVATVLTSAIDDTHVIKAFKESEKLTQGRWWKVCERLFIPAIMWTVAIGVLFLALVIALIVIFAMNPQALTVSHSYILLIAQGLLETLLFLPLTTISIVVLYQDLKKK
ncbi:MAG: hypothetical protein CMI52_03690 [Parcubacteria group bacterium]|nr:hypothetical protein [Parcubacteria group bacterium]